MRSAHTPTRLLLVAMVGVIAGCRSPSPTPAEAASPGQPHGLDPEREVWADVLAYYSQGLIHDLHREYDAAQTNYLHAVELDPDNEPLNFRVAMGLLHRKRTDEAIRLMEQLKARRPDSERVALWLAWIYRAADRNEKAAETYHELIAMKPLDASSYLDAATFFLGTNRREDAVEALERGLKHAEDRQGIRTNLARLKADEAREATDEKQRRKALKRAIALYREASKANPTDLDVLARTGDLYILAGEPEKAIPLFSQVEQANPDDLKMKQRLAAGFLATGDIDEAIARLEDISRKQPTNAQVYYYLGELYQEQGDREHAITNFSLAAKAGNTPAPVIRLALLLLEEEPGEAARVLREGLERRPGYARFLSLLAYAELRDGDTEAALKTFTKAENALQEDERTGAFLYNYGLAWHRSGDTDRAVDYLSSALQKDLGLIEALIQELASKEGDLDEAIGLVVRLAERQPDQTGIQLYLGILQSYAERYEDALATFSRTEELAAEDPLGKLLLDAEFYFNFAAAAERTGAFDRAEELFEKVLTLDPSHLHTLNYLAYMWAERGVKLKEATERVTAALALEPDNAAFLDTLGWIRYKEGRYEDALKEIERAANLLPEDATIVDHLGDIYLQLGREQEALLHWQRSFILDPENEKVREKLEDRDVDLAPLEEQAEAKRTSQEDVPSPATSEEGQ